MFRIIQISQPKTKMFRIVLPDLAATVVGGINPLSRSVRLYAVQMSHDDCGFIIGLKTLVLCTVPAEAPGLLVCLAERFFSCIPPHSMALEAPW